MSNNSLIIEEEIKKLMDNLREEQNVSFRNMIVYDLGKFGKYAVPALIEVSSDKHWNVRRWAFDALAKIGKDAAPAIPVLIEALNDEKVRNEAVYTLGKIGKRAVSPLMKAMKSRSYKVRKAAASALGAIGKGAAPAIPVLIEALKDDNVNISASYALRMIGEQAFTPLMEALEDENSDIRREVASVLESESAIPILIEALDDEDPTIRRKAFYVLGAIGKKVACYVPTLIGILESEDNPEVYEVAVQALEKIRK